MNKLDKTPFPLSVSLHTLDREQQLSTMKLLAKSSVSFVEIWEPTFKQDPDYLSKALKTLSQAGVKARTVHAKFGGELDLSSPDPDVRESGITAANQAIDLAVKMKAEIVIIHPSAEPISDNEREKRRNFSRASLAAITMHASQARCRVAVELLPRTCLGSSAARLLGLLQDLDPKTVGICLDTNHLMGKFDLLPQMVRDLGRRLLALHCSDYDGIDEKHWPPFRGVINWKAFLLALKDINFSGPIHYQAVLDGETPTEKLAFLEENFAELMSVIQNPGK